MKNRQTVNRTASIGPPAIAAWMAEQMRQTDYLYQEEVVEEIADRFGERFTYENENGNAAISREVLAEFRKLTEPAIVWDRSERAWRRREKGDGVGRQVE